MERERQSKIHGNVMESREHQRREKIFRTIRMRRGRHTGWCETDGGRERRWILHKFMRTAESDMLDDRDGG